MDQRDALIRAMRAAADMERDRSGSVGCTSDSVSAVVLAREIREIAEQRWPGKFSAETSS